MYLKDRRPVVLTHNPFVAFADDPKKEYNDQVKYDLKKLSSNVVCKIFMYCKHLPLDYWWATVVILPSWFGFQ